MKKLSIRVVSIVLSILMIVYLIPMSVYANMVQDLFDNDNESDSNEQIVREVFEAAERREESVKHFRLEDGSYTAVQYDVPVHYLDEDGEWQDIDNTLSASGSEYSTSNARVKFAKKITGNETLFTLHDGNRKITMSLDGAIKKTKGQVTNTETEFDENATKLQKLMTLDKLSSRIMYEDILDGVDLEYVVESLNIKENIIVKERKDSYSYTFTVKLNNLEAELNDDGSVSIVDPGSEDVVYLIPAPVVYDANMSYADSSEAYYTLVKTGNNEYKLTVTADTAWMNSPDRAFPVTVDPAVCVNSTLPMTDTYIDSDNPSSTYYSFDFMASGHGSAGQDFISYWKINTLPVIPDNSYISSVKLELYCRDFRPHGSASVVHNLKLGVYKMGTGWTSGATWNSMAQATETFSYLIDYAVVKPISEYSYVSWDITSAFKDWYSGASINHGVAIKQIGSDNADALFSSNEATSNRPRLIVNYRDMKGMGSYWSASTHSAGLAGSGYVNNATGNLVFSIGTVATGDALLGFTPSLVYNSAVAKKYNTYSYNTNVPYIALNAGQGLKLNVNESLVKRSFVNENGVSSTYYVWSDGDGTEHYFMPVEGSSSKYKDEDGLMMTLTEGAVDISIEDSNHNTRYFSKGLGNTSDMYDGGVLRHISDKYGNKLEFNCNSKGQVTSIYILPSGHSSSSKIEYLTLSYNNLGVLYEVYNSVTGLKAQIEYGTTFSDTSSSTINGGPLRKITYMSKNGSSWKTESIVSYSYTNAAGSETSDIYRLASAKDETSGAEIRYTYDSSGRVASVQEYGENAAGQKIGFTYGIGYTEVRSSGSDDVYGSGDDIITHYTFDNEGRAVSVYSMDSSRTVIYGASSGEYESGNANAKNDLKSSAVSGGNTTNYIFDGGFEIVAESGSAAGWTLSSSNVQLATGSYNKGTTHIAFNVKKNTTDSITQYVRLRNGEYTLSADVVTRECKDVKVIISAKPVGDNSRKYEKVIAVNDTEVPNTVKPSVTFTSDTGNAELTGEIFEITVSVTGGANTDNVNKGVEIDNISLENGIGAGKYSMLQFGSFENTNVDINGNSIQSRSSYWKTNSGSSPSISKSSSPFNMCLKIDGDTESVTDCGDYVSQTVKVFPQSTANLYYTGTTLTSPLYFELGKSRTYTLSGFAKGSRQVANDLSYFGLWAEVTYYDGSIDRHYFDFVHDITDWQYVSGTFSTDEGKLIKEIKAECVYMNHPGTAYFADISLVEIEDTSTARYGYYNDGNLMVMKTPVYSEYYEYEDNNLTLTATSERDLYEYSYNTSGVLTGKTYSKYSIASIDGVTVNEPDVYVNWYGPEILSDPDVHISKEVLSRTAYNINKYGLNTSTVVSGKSDSDRKLYSSMSYDTVTGSATFGRMLSSTDTSGNSVYYKYNSKGQLQYEYTPSYTGLYYYYDGMGRMTQVTPLEYSPSLNVILPVASGEKVNYTYNSKNQLSAVSTETTEYSFTYDSYGNTKSIKAGSYTLATYNYKANNGKLESLVYGNGTTVRYVYDELDRVKEIWYTEGSTESLKYTYSYTDDGKIHMVEDHDSGEGHMYSYDGKGRMAGYITYSLSDNNIDTSINYTYDVRSRLEWKDISFAYTCGTVNKDSFLLYYYGYNDDDALTELEICLGNTFNKINLGYTYDNLYRLSGRTYKYNTSYTNTVGYVYKDRGSTYTTSQVSQYSTKVNNNSATTYTYTYDTNGNIAKIVDNSGKVTKYYYDDVNQLIREDNPYLNKSYSYSYNKNGNRISKSTYQYTTASSLPSELYQSYEYYEYNNSAWGDRMTSYMGTPITYDEIGNPLTYSNYEYEWENGRQLKKITVGAGISKYEYTYNAEGIRTSKTVNGTTHYYTLNGSQILTEQWGDKLLVFLYDESGSPIGMQYRTDSMAEGEFYTYLFEKNLQGDIIAVYNTSGTKLISYVYDAWGNVTATNHNVSGTNTGARYTPFRYRGYYYDTESGLYYLQSRYYNPQWGRFLNADGYVSTGTGILSYNMYAYCNNNPVMFTDPTGELIGLFLTIVAVTTLVAAPIVMIFDDILQEIDDTDSENELYNSDRIKYNDDIFNEKAFWYDVEGGKVSNDGCGFIDASCGLDKGKYTWEYFEMEAGVAKISGTASSSITKGIGFSANAETVYGTACIKIPILGHELKLGVSGNLGGVGASCVVGATTEIGVSFIIGGKVSIEWD